MKFLVLLVFLVLHVNAEYIKKVYFVKSNDINLSVITKDYKNDKTIFHIQRDRYLKRVRTKDLLKILEQNGYHRFKTKTSYVNFIKESNIDTSSLKQKLISFYKQTYKNIDIKQVKIIPKTHLETLNEDYSFNIQPRSALLSHSTFSIKISSKKQIFFDYYIDANLYVYKSKIKIKKGEILNGRNLKRVYVKLDKFRYFPIQDYIGFQAKHHINKNKIITTRDITKIDLVTRGGFVSVVLKDSDLEIDFSAKSIQNGSLGDIVLIQTSKGKKLRAKVIGKNLVQIEAVR